MSSNYSPTQQAELFEQAFALFESGRLTEAASHYQNLLHDFPRDSELLAGLGTVALQQGSFAEAVSFLGQALAIDPAQECILTNLGLAYAQLKQSTEVLRCYAQPLWLGETAIADKTLLIYPEQGYGDFIQFCRYAPLLELLGAQVVLEAPAALFTLMNSLQGRFTLVKQGAVLPAFDLHCPIMSLPLAFKTTLASIPDGVPYLYADQAKQAVWQARLRKQAGLRVGLVWAGSRTHKNDYNRSIPLALLDPLLQLPFQFHALQKEFSPEEAALLMNYPRLHKHAEGLDDFSDTAALINEMDLVICVDTTVAHLAGAMALPVWVLLPFNPDCRWLLDRPDSPWYPSARLFRQTILGDWESVIAEVVRNLGEFE